MWRWFFAKGNSAFRLLAARCGVIQRARCGAVWREWSVGEARVALQLLRGPADSPHSMIVGTVYLMPSICSAGMGPMSPAAVVMLPAAEATV